MFMKLGKDHLVEKVIGFRQALGLTVFIQMRAIA